MCENQKLTIEDAIFLLNLPYPTGRRSVTIECPFCGSEHKNSRKTFNINYEKDVFNCPRCGVQGAALQFWALHRGINYTDVKEAAKDYYSFVEGGNSNVTLQPRKELPKRIDVDTADIETRNRTFRQLLATLGLSDQHRENLRKRGLSDEVIDKNGYKTYPVTCIKNIIETLLCNGCILKGCQGFYRDEKDDWTMLRISSGFLIPQRDGILQDDGLGRIQGFQIRLDGDSGVRYITLSTGDYKCGAKGSAYVHCSPGKKGLKEVIITEGPLKGDIISHFTGYTVLAMQGVGSQSGMDEILGRLRQKGTSKIYTAFDMDLAQNQMVQNSLNKLQQKIENAGLVHQQIVWDEQYKGLDDYLAANCRK